MDTGLSSYHTSELSPNERVTFHLLLNCTSRNTTESKRLVLDFFPASVLELKEQIEAHLSIPVCVQTLSYQSIILRDDESLESKCIRSGDTLHLSYLCEGDCKELTRVIEWLTQLTRAILNEDTHADVHTQQVIDCGVQENLDVRLALELFDWLDAKSHVNKIYFEKVGGLDVLLNLYKILLGNSWGKMAESSKYLESTCTQSIANFGETFPLRRLILQRGVLQSCIQSLLRVELRKGFPVIDEESDSGDPAINSHLLQRVIENALHILCNFSELPECQLAIASQPNVLQQIISMSLSASYNCSTSVLVAEVFLCLAHTLEAHPYLAQFEVVDGLLDACRMRPLLVQDLQNERVLLVALKCFTHVIVAQLALMSPKMLPKRYLGTIHTYMKGFLEKALPAEVRKYEEDQVCIWATLLPYLKLLYLPNAPRTFPDDPLLSKLQLLSIDAVLLFLHSKIIGENHREVLLKEGLLDFVFCMPWHVPYESRDRARALVSELCNHIRPQPPKLCTLAKAKLAKMYFGLEKIVKMTSVGEILQDVFPV